MKKLSIFILLGAIFISIIGGLTSNNEEPYYTVDNKIESISNSATNSDSVADTIQKPITTDTISTVNIKQATSISSSDDDKEDIVYKTNTGSKYHRSGCQYLSKSKIAVTREKAIRQGYTPCSRCNP